MLSAAFAPWTSTSVSAPCCLKPAEERRAPMRAPQAYEAIADSSAPAAAQPTPSATSCPDDQ
eukprot:4645076-Prymnesium_polylepis.1